MRRQAFGDEVTAAIRNAGLDATITQVGHRSDPREIMSVSDAVISLSQDPEAFGRVTLEALSLGCPVAGYDHGGVHEQLSALLPAGAVVPRGVDAMTDLLAKWYHEAAYPRENASFTLDTMLRKTLQVYESLTVR